MYSLRSNDKGKPVAAAAAPVALAQAPQPVAPITPRPVTVVRLRLGVLRLPREARRPAPSAPAPSNLSTLIPWQLPTDSPFRSAIAVLQKARDGSEQAYRDAQLVAALIHVTNKDELLLKAGIAFLFGEQKLKVRRNELIAVAVAHDLRRLNQSEFINSFAKDVSDYICKVEV